MNLRDQFLKAGLVDKKRADQVAREAKKELKVAHGNALDKSTIERQAAESRAVAEKKRQEELLARRQPTDTRVLAAAADQSKLYSTRQILRSHRQPIRGGTQRFWHRSPDGTQIWRLTLSEWMATDLRCGRLVIAWCDDDHPEVVVIDPIVANRIETTRPELILFRNRGPIVTDPSEQLYEEALDTEPGAPRGRKR